MIPIKGMYPSIIKTCLSIQSDFYFIFESYSFFIWPSCYSHWSSIFAVMLGTGLRVGEVTGLRWSDIDLDNGVIDVNHTLVYYSHRSENSQFFA